MVRRHHKIDFASGALVFPGGKVDAGDMEEGLSQLCTAVPESLNDLPFYIAAIRETYEECGILLAKRQDTLNRLSNLELKELAPYRKKLVDESVTMAEFLRTENLIADTEGLQLFAHWITPDMMPKRFDTYFFLVHAPEGQKGIHDGTESVDSTWISPKKLLSDHDTGKRSILFPTRVNLSKLARFETVESALSHTRSEKIPAIQPWIEEREAGSFLCIPKDAGYPITEDSLDAILKNRG